MNQPAPRYRRLRSSNPPGRQSDQRDGQQRHDAAERTGDDRQKPDHQGRADGSESLYIDGKVEGSITLDGNRVTMGRNGKVHANIPAREVVVLGKVKGNIHATDRVDIRADGSLTGDVIAQRISIETERFSRAESTSASREPKRLTARPRCP